MSHYNCRVSDPYLIIAHLHIAKSNEHHSPLVIIHAIFTPVVFLSNLRALSAYYY
jgi:hypothetical protein